MCTLSEVLLPDVPGLHLDKVVVNRPENQLVLTVYSTQTAVPCPCCKKAASRFHSYYWRTLADLPCAGLLVRWQLRVRRFYCANSDCPRRIFNERLPAVVQPWARRTHQLAQAQQAIGLALGGIAGYRLAKQLQMSASVDTLLRLVRQLEAATASSPRVLGIDDWALRKGTRYGTIVVDLEAGRIIDLLPDCRTETVANWLKERPTIEVISRDRATAFAEAAATGASQATQVADRWHLLRNLGEALTAILEPHHTTLKQVTADSIQGKPPTPPPVTIQTLGYIEPIRPRLEEQQQQRRQQRRQRYETVRQLHDLGWTVASIARETNLDPKTVRRFLQASTFPERQSRRVSGSILDPYKPYLLDRWNKGCRTGAQLLREIRAKGYAGGDTLVNAFLAQVRRLQGLPPKTRMVTPHQPVKGTKEVTLTPRRATWLILGHPDALEPANRQQLVQLVERLPDLEQAVALSREFAAMVRQRQAGQLDVWLERAAASPYLPLRNFAKGIRRDYQAVRAALSSQWSNGPTEGHVNRLKFVKRQMYGRANFDLLKLRVLYAH